MRSFEIYFITNRCNEISASASLAEEKPSFDSNQIQPKSIPLMITLQGSPLARSESSLWHDEPSVAEDDLSISPPSYFIFLSFINHIQFCLYAHQVNSMLQKIAKRQTHEPSKCKMQE